MKLESSTEFLWRGRDKKCICRAKAGFSKHPVRTRIHLLKPGLQLLDFKVTSELNLKWLSDGEEIQTSTRITQENLLVWFRQEFSWWFENNYY